MYKQRDTDVGLFFDYIVLSLRAQSLLRGVVAPCYQHYSGIDSKGPQLHSTNPEFLDYIILYCRTPEGHQMRHPPI